MENFSDAKISYPHECQLLRFCFATLYCTTHVLLSCAYMHVSFLYIVVQWLRFLVCQDHHMHQVFKKCQVLFFIFNCKKNISDVKFEEVSKRTHRGYLMSTILFLRANLKLKRRTWHVLQHLVSIWWFRETSKRKLGFVIPFVPSII